MLSLARSLHPQIDFRQGDAELLPVPDGSFDAVVANFLMLHLGRPERAAKEFARALVPGGRVALTVWDLPEQARFLGVLVEAVAEAEATPPDDIHVESSPESLWRGLLGGTVRVSALILWPREMQQRIRAGEARLGPQVGTSR